MVYANKDDLSRMIAVPQPSFSISWYFCLRKNCLPSCSGEVTIWSAKLTYLNFRCKQCSVFNEFFGSALANWRFLQVIAYILCGSPILACPHLYYLLILKLSTWAGRDSCFPPVGSGELLLLWFSGSFLVSWTGNNWAAYNGNLSI